MKRIFANANNQAGAGAKTGNLVSNARGANPIKQLDATRKGYLLVLNFSAFDESLRIANTHEGTAEIPIARLIKAKY